MVLIIPNCFWRAIPGSFLLILGSSNNSTIKRKINVKTIILVCNTGIRTQNFSSQNNYICCSRIVSFWQCDQMVRLFLIIWLLTTAQTCPKFVKIANVGLKFCQKQNKQSKVCLRFWKFVQVAKFRQIWSQCFVIFIRFFLFETALALTC